MPQGDFSTFPSTVVSVAFTFVGGYVFFVGWWVPRLVLTFKARHWITNSSVSASYKEKETTTTKKMVNATGIQTFLQSSLWCSIWWEWPPEEELEWWLDIIMPWGTGSSIVEQRIIGVGLVPMFPEYKGWASKVKIPTEPSYWPENLLLCLLFVALVLVLTSNFPSNSEKIELQKFEAVSVPAPSLVWLQPVCTILILWATHREDVFSRVYSNINFWTSTLVYNINISLPVVSQNQTFQRLKIVYPVSSH